jgi:hypothetical protein
MEEHDEERKGFLLPCSLAGGRFRTFAAAYAQHFFPFWLLFQVLLLMAKHLLEEEARPGRKNGPDPCLLTEHYQFPLQV